MSKAEAQWDEFAKRILSSEKQTRQYCHPRPVGVLVEWKQGTYIGTVQEVAPDYSKEIVALSKTSQPLAEELVNSIKKFDPHRQYFHVDESIDLEGRQHALRRADKELTRMTEEQTAYMMTHKLVITEL